MTMAGLPEDFWTASGVFEIGFRCFVSRMLSPGAPLREQLAPGSGSFAVKPMLTVPKMVRPEGRLNGNRAMRVSAQLPGSSSEVRSVRPCASLANCSNKPGRSGEV